MDEIWDYIAYDLLNPSAAKSTVDSILDAVDQLESFAEMGPLLSSIANVNGDYRFLATGNYLTFYRVHGSNVYVDRILYGRQDYLRILFGDSPNGEKD